MPEPLSDGRLAEIRERAAHITEYGGATADEEQLSGVDVPDLLAEVERLNYAIQGGLQHVGEALEQRDLARDAAVALEQQNARYLQRIQELAAQHRKAATGRAEWERLCAVQKRYRQEAEGERDQLAEQHAAASNDLQFVRAAIDAWLTGADPHNTLAAIRDQLNNAPIPGAEADRG